MADWDVCEDRSGLGTNLELRSNLRIGSSSTYLGIITDNLLRFLHKELEVASDIRGQ